MRERRSSGLRPPRVLLVGLSSFMLNLLDGPLGRQAHASCVPFPSPLFERVAAEMRPDLVVVDVGYLDEARVRPVMLARFGDTAKLLVFTTSTGYCWIDDIQRGTSDAYTEFSPEQLLEVVRPPRLRSVTEA